MHCVTYILSVIQYILPSYYATLHDITLVLWCTKLHCTLHLPSYDTAIHYITTQHYITLCHINTLHCITLCHINTLHYIILHGHHITLHCHGLYIMLHCISFTMNISIDCHCFTGCTPRRVSSRAEILTVTSVIGSTIWVKNKSMVTLYKESKLASWHNNVTRIL